MPSAEEADKCLQDQKHQTDHAEKFDSPDVHKQMGDPHKTGGCVPVSGVLRVGLFSPGYGQIQSGSGAMFHSVIVFCIQCRAERIAGTHLPADIQPHLVSMVVGYVLKQTILRKCVPVGIHILQSTLAHIALDRGIGNRRCKYHKQVYGCSQSGKNGDMGNISAEPLHGSSPLAVSN